MSSAATASASGVISTCGAALHFSRSIRVHTSAEKLSNATSSGNRLRSPSLVRSMASMSFGYPASTTTILPLCSSDVIRSTISSSTSRSPARRYASSMKSTCPSALRNTSRVFFTACCANPVTKSASDATCTSLDPSSPRLQYSSPMRLATVVFPVPGGPTNRNAIGTCSCGLPPAARVFTQIFCSLSNRATSASTPLSPAKISCTVRPAADAACSDTKSSNTSVLRPTARCAAFAIALLTAPAFPKFGFRFSGASTSVTTRRASLNVSCSCFFSTDARRIRTSSSSLKSSKRQLSSMLNRRLKPELHDRTMSVISFSYPSSSTARSSLPPPLIFSTSVLMTPSRNGHPPRQPPPCAGSSPHASSMTSTQPTAPSSMALVFLSLSPSTFPTRSDAVFSTTSPLLSTPAAFRISPNSAATVVLPVPGLPRRTRFSGTSSSGISSSSRRTLASTTLRIASTASFTRPSPSIACSVVHAAHVRPPFSTTPRMSRIFSTRSGGPPRLCRAACRPTIAWYAFCTSRALANPACPARRATRRAATFRYCAFSTANVA
eukprot:Rhum_TRINITY_DN15504_c2_g2::Rhum_TRINITY_DN15504_c2_g2_i2::g.160753::m.160753